MAEENTVDKFSAIKEGIRYQIMKENSKRTSFASNNQQIMFRGRQALQGIEKHEKLMSSDFRKQQTTLMGKFEKLQKKKETLGILPASWNLTERRHSEPIGDLNTHSSLLKYRFKKSTTLAHDSDDSDNNDEDVEHDSRKTQHRSTSQLHKQQRNRDNRTSPRISEARRQSQDIQKEILATSLPRLEAIMASSHRRATISDSDSLSDYFPSSKEINRLSRLCKKSSSVDEESG